MSKWKDEKKQVLEASRKMVEKGLVIGTSGNISLRLPPLEGRELLAITPSSRYYDTMNVDDIQIIDFDTEPVEGDLPPSVETMLHIGIYKARRNVNAVIHTHPVYASALSVSGIEIPVILEDQVTYLGGEIRLAKYALPGSDELVENVISALGERNAVLLPNHGAVGVGRSMRDAFTANELIEKTAKVYLSSLSLGKVNLLPVEAAEMGRAFFAMLNSSIQ